MRSLTLTIPGVPIAQRRPRFARRGKFVVTYSDQATEAGKFLLEARRQAHGVFLEGPLSLEVICVFPRPKSHFGTGKNADKLKASAPEDHTKKPDCTNLCKFVEDCLNDEVYKDDSQICVVRIRKVYAEDGCQPYTWIKLTELEGLP